MNKCRLIIPFATLILFSADSYSKTEEVDIGHRGNDNNVSRTVELTQVDNLFLPAEISVNEGETIRLVVKNGGSSRHEMILGSIPDLKEIANRRRKFPDKPHDEADLLRLEPGEQKELIWQFPSAGIVNFACPLPGHFKRMRGTITVEKK
ncbi:hypothetical protein ABF87_04455 [Nitrosomonas sp. JL21]|uniref:cupredoxin domain-containing protein n=1 Tax=Nitrosomonas sp. JL21 TaxID=153949 RepID=UPI00136D46B9|nr:plastocyanin/azurin family copper-binding protein [Nitrosomonas sp. JL21]MBL8497763.1 hypothetical protein [Nitrosomonas sp.]MCC7091641.1 hypothetical protein [Nitrosomonas sp.]MXS77224.1 hypothetical protein [Nitrosomonas sp. JL21]